MKTAISIPDELFEEAEQEAKRRGLSRSELYANAVREYVEKYRTDDITGRLDEIYAETDSRLDPALQHMQNASLKREDW